MVVLAWVFAALLISVTGLAPALWAADPANPCVPDSGAVVAETLKRIVRIEYIENQGETLAKVEAKLGKRNETIPVERPTSMGTFWADKAKAGGTDPYLSPGTTVLSKETFESGDLLKGKRIAVIIPPGRKVVHFEKSFPNREILGSHNKLATNHAVDAAGEIAFISKGNGRYSVEITNKSGGYHPSPDSVYHLVDALLDAHLPIDEISVFLDHGSGPEPTPALVLPGRHGP